MKKFKIIAIFMLSMVCFASALSGFNQKAFAASSGTITYSQQQKTVTQISSIGTYSLFDGISSDNYGNYASAYVKYVLSKPSLSYSDNGLKLTSGNASGASKVNDNLFIYSDLSSALSTAIKNGTVAVVASVKLKSDADGEKDSAEKLYAVLQVGSHGGITDSGVNVSLDRTDDDIGVDKNFSVVASTNAQDSVNGKQWTTFTEYTMSLSPTDLQGLDCKSISIHAYTDFVKPSGFLYAATSHNTMYLTAPSITLTTTDTTAPQVNKCIVEDKSDDKKLVTIYVSDSESGVQNVTLQNGTAAISPIGEPNFDETTRNAIYKFEVSCGVDYSIVATDNVGNTSSQQLKVNDISVKSFYVQKDISIVSSLDKSLNYYYTTDGSEPTNESNSLLNGESIVTVENNGDYTLKVKGIYSNGSFIYYEKSFRVDDTDYLVTVSGNNIDEIEPRKVKYGTSVVVEISADEGYSLYKVFINDEEQPTKTQYSLDVTKNTNIQVYCRKVVENLIPIESTFVYDGYNVQLDFGINVQDFVFTCNGSAELPQNAGSYNIVWSVDSETQVGEGNFDITIEKREVVVESVIQQYVYKQFDFTYTLSNPEDDKYVTYIVKRETGATIVLSQPIPGEYTYEIYSENENVLVDGNTQGKLNISKIKVKFNFNLDEITKQFDGVVHKITAYMQEEIEDLKEKFGVTVSLDGESVENVYNVGTYTCNVQLDEEMLQYYETDSQESFVIAPRQIKITPKKGQYRYIGQEDSTIEYSAELPEGVSLGGTLSRESGNNAGDYAIELGSLSVVCDDASNYQVVLDDSEQVFYTILSKQLLVKADSFVVTYGEEEPTLTAQILYGALNDGERLVVSREQGNDVGSYAIKNVCVVDEANNDVTANYSLIIIGGIYKINPRSLIVTPISFTKVYGQCDETINYTADSLLLGDVLYGSLSREVGEDVGAYDITIGTLENKNYTITLNNAFCTIEPQNVEVLVKDAEKTFGQEDANITAECAQTDINDLNLVFVREEGENVGTYVISVASHNGNYNVISNEAKLTIKPQSVYITIASATKVYGNSDPEFTYTLDGEYDNIQVVVSREVGESVGTYKLIADCSANYVLSCNDATLTINKADADFEIESQSVVYNGAEQYMIVDDCFAVIYRDASGTKIESPKNAGTYTAEITYIGDENHNDKTIETTFTIEKKRVSVVIDATAIKYTGKEVMPIFSTPNFDSSAATIDFDGQQIPVEVGCYGYTINYSDDNYYFNIHAVLEIVE